MNERLWRIAPALAAVAVMAAAIALRLAEPAFVGSIRNEVFDAYQRWQPRQAEPLPVRILDIDDESLARLGQWPWPRTVVADLVGRLDALGAAAIVFDVVFAEPDRTSPQRVLRSWRRDSSLDALIEGLPDHDRVLAEAVGQARVVTAFALTAEPNRLPPPARPYGFAVAGPDPAPLLARHPGAVVTLPEIERAAQGNGAITFVSDGDGVVRRVPLLLRHGDQVLASLVGEAVRVAQGARTYIVRVAAVAGESGRPSGITDVKIGEFAIPTDREGQLWLHAAPFDPGRYIPAWRLLADDVAAETIEGAIVLVGTSAAGLQDLRFSPLGGTVPGVDLHAQAIEQILSSQFLNRPDWAVGAEVVFITVLGALLMALTQRMGALPAAAVGVAALGVAAATSVVGFVEWRTLIDPIYPAFSVLAIYLSHSTLRHVQTERRQRWVRDAFARYISPNLVDQLVRHPERLRLGGERRELTFLFTDLAGFTTMVERSEPTELVPLINEYLNQMIHIGFAHGGTLDKIVGDAVVFYFGAPVAQPDHAARGYACAMAMDAFADSFAAAKRALGIPLGKTRIGVHTGEVIIGNMGGDAIFNYTALGDPINTAARLESVNKHLGTRVCISEATGSRCPDFRARPVGDLVLKGKAKALAVFEPLAEADAASPRVAAYRAAFDMMAGGEAGAEAAFAALAEAHPDDPLVRFHRERLARGETGRRIVMEEK